ncbi:MULTISPECIES: hypothetical protein [unclassified Streptomyces]|uniref:hypothetical protein n=1 Tax=unclassified Streptomyces TaxID=2593676 RepID=UPI0037926826
MIDMGIRIEFFDPATLGSDHRRLLGALCRQDGYLALGLPAVGSQISVSSLRVTPRGDWQPMVLGSTLRVCDVVHQPAPRRQGNVPAWWGEFPCEPTATVVLRAALRGSAAMLIPRMLQFAADGWTLQDPAEGSELQTAWRVAQQQITEQRLFAA